MNTDLKAFRFLLTEYHMHRAGFKYMRAWDYATTVEKLRANAAYMIAKGIDPSVMPYEFV